MLLTYVLIVGMLLGGAGMFYDYFVLERSADFYAAATVFIFGVLVIEKRLREIRDRLDRTIDDPPPSSSTEKDGPEQIRRARKLLAASSGAAMADPHLGFTCLIGAMHLARSIPEHWYTCARDKIPADLNLSGETADEMSKSLPKKMLEVFKKARRYDLLTDLRTWDYHWEPLTDPRTVAPNLTYGRGAPPRLRTGPGPGTVAYTAGNKVLTTGSGRRVGRTNYYQIQQQRFVDFEAGELVPLHLAIKEFLDDLPEALAAILELDEVREWMKRAAG